MVSDIIKKFIAKSWEYSARMRLTKKFKLYGSYKKKYTWGKYFHIDEHIALFRPLNYKVNTAWYKYFTLVRQEENPAYLPEDIWHICLEPVLNQRSYAKAFNDKNLFDLLDYKNLYPKAYVHVIQGICYNPDYKQISFEHAFESIPISTPFVAKKAIDSGGGKGVGFYESKSSIQGFHPLIEKHGQNFIIQEKVRQYDWFSKFNPTSVNTIRVVTYRSVLDEKVSVLQTLLRIGNPGSMVDNQSSGGIACGIDNNGNLNNWGCDKLSNRYTSVNGFDFSSEEQIPDFELLKNTCIEIAKTRFHERVLVFDTWRDTDNNIRLLEINNITLDYSRLYL